MGGKLPVPKFSSQTRTNTRAQASCLTCKYFFMLVELENVMIPNLARQTIYLAAFLRLEHKLVLGFGYCRHLDFSLFSNLWISSPKVIGSDLQRNSCGLWPKQSWWPVLFAFLLSFSIKGNPTPCTVDFLSCRAALLLQIVWYDSGNRECSTVQYWTCRGEGKSSYSIKIESRWCDGDWLKRGPLSQWFTRSPRFPGGEGKTEPDSRSAAGCAVSDLAVMW